MWGEQHRGSKRKARPYTIAQDSFVVVNPVVQGRWGEDYYGAIRPEDVRFVLLLELIDEKIDGEWVDSKGQHVSYTYVYTFHGTVYDLLTGEKATFLDTSDSSIRDQVEKFIDDANANSKR